MELTGNGFILRNWLPGDEVSLQKHADNPNVSATLLDRFPSPYTIEDAQAWVKMFEDQQPVVNFAISINGEVVGGIRLNMRADIYRKTPLLGYWLSESYWGNGIMPEAVKLITNYAFNQLDAICIQALALSSNPASMRVLEKAGYQKQGILKKSVVKHEQILDEHVFGISNAKLTV